MATGLSEERTLAEARTLASGLVEGACSSSTANERVPAIVGLPLRRALAMLLLPLSLAPIVVLAPALTRAPGVLVGRWARIVAPAHGPVYRAPYEPPRYPSGSSRLGRDILEPVAGPLTPQVGVSPLAEHETPAERAGAPLVLITGEPQSGGR
jgi:hypothetical protein